MKNLKNTIEVNCRGYYEIDVFGTVSYPCPSDTSKFFHKKPSLYRCNQCWKKIIAFEKKWFTPINEVLAFCKNNASYWEYFNGRLVAFNSNSEPLMYSDYIEWLRYKNPQKHLELLKKRDTEITLKKQEARKTHDRKEQLIKTIKITSLLNKFKQGKVKPVATLRDKQTFNNVLRQKQIQKEQLQQTPPIQSSQPSHALNSLKSLLKKPK